MKTIIFKFYNPPKGDKCVTLVGKIIRIVSQRIHVEGLFEDGRSFSSTLRNDITGTDGKFHKGVRFKNIDFTKHPERWEELILNLPDAIYDEILRSCEVLALMKIKYDTRGAIGCFWAGLNSLAKLFCSELWFGLLAMHFALPVLNVKKHPDALYCFIRKIQAVLE